MRGTFRRVFNKWKHDYKYLTELVMVLNHKIWQFYQQGKYDRAELYDSLWQKADGYAVEHLKGEELQYFAKVGKELQYFSKVIDRLREVEK